MGELTNIDQQGFGSAAFHSFPDKMAFDPYSGDYGSGFFGHAFNTGTYVADDSALGWLAFGGNLKVRGTVVSITPLDSFRNRLYLAPFGLWLTLDAGKFKRAEFDTANRTVKLTLDGAGEFTPAALLRIEQPAKVAGVGIFAPVQTLPRERGAYVVSLKRSETEVVLRQK